jgi:hypothetical protein
MVQEFSGYRSSTFLKAYRSSTVLVQRYSDSLVVLVYCRCSRLVHEYMGT